MLELIIEKNKTNKIALIENGKLVEYYEYEKQINKNEDNIYIGIVKDILEGMQSAFVDIGTEKNSFIHLKDLLPKIDETKEQYDNSQNIKDLIKVNDKILVQVKKDSDNKKGARVSTHISLTSRYIILMPNTNIITISKKIQNEKEKQRLIEFIRSNLPQNMGAIIRTSAVNAKEEDLLNDIKFVIKKWEAIQNKYNKENLKSPSLIYQSPDIAEKIIIDMFSNGLSKITVNTQNEYDRIAKILKENTEFEKINLTLNNEINFLNNYEVAKQVEKLQARKVWLNCGGFITIDKTEALTAIDVNTGKYTGKNKFEDTIYKVNEEATIEIAKQLRLRDIGGIIIIDYIDMNNNKHKEKIENLLKERLKSDRAKTQVEGFTKLDLMEMTRKHICNNKE